MPAASGARMAVPNNPEEIVSHAEADADCIPVVGRRVCIFGDRSSLGPFGLGRAGELAPLSPSYSSCSGKNQSPTDLIGFVDASLGRKIEAVPTVRKRKADAFAVLNGLGRR